MSENKSTIVPLNGTNYATWKVQCHMALMKENLWGFVDDTEGVPNQSDVQGYAKYSSRKNCALATVVLSIDPKQLYLLGDPTDPKEVWEKLAFQFQKKSWVNKLQLRRKLYSLRLREGDSMQDHVKCMTEVYDELSVVGDPIKEEDRVAHLLASLPKSFDMLVTALEANAEVPKMEVVTERLLYEEQKLKERDDTGARPKVKEEKAYLSSNYSKNRPRPKGPKCHHCGKVGHIKKNCRDFLRKNDVKSNVNGKFNNAQANNVNLNVNESVGLLVKHALKAGSVHNLQNSWIVDSGATAHMCTNRKCFVSFDDMEHGSVALGDSHSLQSLGTGKVVIRMNLPDGTEKRCILSDVLYVPELLCNLLSVSKATRSGKFTKFSESQCKIFDGNENLIGVANQIGDL